MTKTEILPTVTNEAQIQLIVDTLVLSSLCRMSEIEDFERRAKLKLKVHGSFTPTIVHYTIAREITCYTA